MLEMYLEIERDVISWVGPDHQRSIIAADDVVIALLAVGRYAEAQARAREAAPLARRVFGADHNVTMSLRENIATAVLRADSSSPEETREAFRMYEDVIKDMTRVLGASHPDTRFAQKNLNYCREKDRRRAALRARETPPPPGPSVERTFAPGWLDGPS